MSDPNDELDAVYALKTPEDNRAHYDDWAASYETSFVEKMDYRLPERVVEAFLGFGPLGPVLDVGAGTGIVGALLAGRGLSVDGTDISPAMLAEAEAKGVYRHLFEGDLMARLDVPDGAYGSAISTGTFTSGHVGPQALNEVFRMVRAGGKIVLSVSEAHWEAEGFRAALEAMDCAEMRLEQVAIYGVQARGAHAGDKAIVVMIEV